MNTTSPDKNPDRAADACAAWLARQAEHHRLTLEWQEIETRLCKEHDWLNLSVKRRRRLPEQRTLDALDSRIRALHSQNQKALREILRLAAATPRAMERKLEVALVIVSFDEEDAHRLIKSILRDYRALHR